jgi:hypothetical protein
VIEFRKARLESELKIKEPRAERSIGWSDD